MKPARNTDCARGTGLPASERRRVPTLAGMAARFRRKPPMRGPRQGKTRDTPPVSFRAQIAVVYFFLTWILPLKERSRIEEEPALAVPAKDLPWVRGMAVWASA